MVYSTRRFVLCLTLCYFVLVFFSPFSIAIISLGEERANLSAFRTFVRFYACLVLFVFSSSWCLRRAAICDRGTALTFLFSFITALPRRTYFMRKESEYRLDIFSEGVRRAVKQQEIRQVACLGGNADKSTKCINSPTEIRALY